jgi:hypothetical protein
MIVGDVLKGIGDTLDEVALSNDGGQGSGSIKMRISLLADPRRERERA